jgi:hypothetical protein
MSYSRALLPPGGAQDPHLAAELHRREHGPICARCQFSPLDDHHLPPLVGGDSTPVTRPGMVRQFTCEATGRLREADGGRGCQRFARRN